MNTSRPTRTMIEKKPWMDPEKQAASFRRQQLFSSAILLLVMFGIAALLFLFIPAIPVQSINLGLRVFLLVLGGLLPILIYGFFAQNRLPTLFVEYKQNLRRLGLPENSEVYQKKFETIYGRSPDIYFASQPFLISETPIIITTLFCIFGWFIVYFPIADPGTLLPNQTVMGFGFLGAYIFAISALVRLYLQDDLQTRYYASLISRFVTVFILSWLVGMMLNYLDPVQGNQDLYLLAAFIIGIFPSVGLATIQRIGSQIFGETLGGHKEPYPLLDLDGFNAYHVDRLVLDGIENQQNMAGANIVDLMLRTRYTVEQIVDWIDQSLLHLHARERIGAFKKCGYRTATDFLDAFNGIEQADPTTLDEWRKRMASLLAAQLPAGEDTSLDEEQIRTLMQTIASSLQFAPNFFHVRYWRRHEYEALPEDVERFRTEADLKLIQGLKDDAIEAYNQVLDQFPNSLATRLYLGLAYFQKGDYQKAINQYERLIEQSSSQSKTVVTSYIELGSAYRELGEFEKARASYEKIFELDRENLEAHLDLAYLQMSRLSEYSQAIDHLNAAIEGDFRKANALATRGLARLELWKRSRAGSEPVAANPTGPTLLEEARDDLQLALRLNPELVPAYINLVLVYQEAGNSSDALGRLEEVIRKLETETGKPPTDLENAYRARLLRGNIYMSLGDLPAAVENYRIAARIAPFDVAAFYNLGVAYQQLARSDPKALDEARRAYQEVVNLKPGHAPAHQALGSLQLIEKQVEQAEGSFKIALRLSRERGDIKGQALARLSLGKLYRLSGRSEEARRELNESSKQADEQNDDLTYTEAIFELALLDLSAAQGAAVKDPAAFGRAAASLETASALFEALNLPRQAARASLELGNARLAEGESTESKAAWARARKLLTAVFDPTNSEDTALLSAIDAAESG